MSDLPNRAKTPEQKRDVIDALFQAWLEHPELRLGQLFVNTAGGDPFYVEDFDLVAKLGDLNRKEVSCSPCVESNPQLLLQEYLRTPFAEVEKWGAAKKEG